VRVGEGKRGISKKEGTPKPNLYCFDVWESSVSDVQMFRYLKSDIFIKCLSMLNILFSIGTRHGRFQSWRRLLIHPICSSPRHLETSTYSSPINFCGPLGNARSRFFTKRSIAKVKGFDGRPYNISQATCIPLILQFKILSKNIGWWHYMRGEWPRHAKILFHDQ